MKKRQKVWLVLGISAAAVGMAVLYAGWRFYCHNIENWVSRDGERHEYYIYPNASMDSVIDVISSDYEIKSVLAFRKDLKKSAMTEVKPGHYTFGDRFGNRVIIKRLMKGEESPVKLTFTNMIRNREQLSSRLGRVLLMDSAEVMSLLDSVEFLESFGLTKETAICLFIPNTYEVYWTISPEQLFARMEKEYKHFWSSDRLAKAERLGLTPFEVATLASIVESETNNRSEHPIIAGLYLNRLRKGMALQACPTAIYASGDFGLRRVLKRHTEIDSPYNTYKYAGLPPGPIRCANGVTMDAVLDYTKSDYLYMCANPDFSGTHVFSSSYSHHQAVAEAYRRALNRRRIN